MQGYTGFAVLILSLDLPAPGAGCGPAFLSLPPLHFYTGKEDYDNIIQLAVYLFAHWFSHS